MNQLSVLSTQLNDLDLDEEGRLLLRRRVSREQVFASDFGGARETLGEYRLGDAEAVTGPSERAEAELLLRATC